MWGKWGCRACVHLQHCLMVQVPPFWAHLCRPSNLAFCTSALSPALRNNLIMHFKCAHYLFMALPLSQAGLEAVII